MVHVQILSQYIFIAKSHEKTFLLFMNVTHNLCSGKKKFTSVCFFLHEVL